MNSRFAMGLGCVLVTAGLGYASNHLLASEPSEVIVKAGHFQALTEPPCSYVSTQHRKGIIGDHDPVVAWIRGAHNGGAIPMRHFLATSRIINDTYGLFFYDADGGYVSVFGKDYGYQFYGWRKGVMLAQGRDGTIWSCLTGRGLEGPQKGHRLERVPSFLTDWGHWRMLHPESTTYDLFDGTKYPLTELPVVMTVEARASMGTVDPREPPEALVLGVEGPHSSKAFPLHPAVERACYTDRIDGQPIAVFWYGPTSSAIAFQSRLEDRELTFYADDMSPETAPFKDHETGTRWTLAGRGVDGPLRGKELKWMPSIQCRWYAWAAEYPETSLYDSAPNQ